VRTCMRKALVTAPLLMTGTSFIVQHKPIALKLAQQGHSADRLIETPADARRWFNNTKSNCLIKHLLYGTVDDTTKDTIGGTP
jgi:hypothetical protein